MGHATCDTKNASAPPGVPDRNPGKSALRREIHLAENLSFLRAQAPGGFDLIYIDPPFNTGSTRRGRSVRAERVPEDERDARGAYVGFGGARYRRVDSGAPVASYDDAFDDYPGFLEPRMRECRRVLKPTGSLFVHVDPRESHYVKVMLDGVFGRRSFMNEIVWAYDFGGRSKSRWSAKHDVILWYAMDPERYTFNFDAMDRIPYMAPGLVGPEKAARGKTPTDVWWHTIVSPTGREKTGYPTQKPLGVLERIIRVHSDPGDVVLDCFAGSGTTGAAAAKHGRGFVLVDQSAEAVRVMEKRLGTPSVTACPTGRRP